MYKTGDSMSWRSCQEELEKEKPHYIEVECNDENEKELSLLAREVSDLQTRLNELTNKTTTVCKRKWTWCDVAESQRKDVQTGLHEQKRLKLAVHEHMDLIASLQDVMKSTQRVPVDEWRGNRLPEDEDEWKRGILSMLTRDYERLDTMLVRNGLVDSTTNMCKTVVRRDCKGTVTSIDKVTHLQLQCHTYDDVVKIMNALIMTEKGRECLVKGTKWDTLELLERMECDSMYMKCKSKCQAGPIQWLEGQVAIKRFVEPTRMVIIVRSVLEDARHPLAHGTCYPHDEVGWFVVERSGVCSVKSIVSCTPSPPKRLNVCPYAMAIQSAAVSAADSVQKWFRSCVNVYRQQNRSVTELFMHALAQRFRPLLRPLCPPPTQIEPTSPTSSAPTTSMIPT